MNVVHFAIHADDLDRAMAFYRAVFGWRFTAWGPPGFYMIATGDESDPGIHGSLEQRMVPLSGAGIAGFECTISIADPAATAALIAAHGGTVTLAPTVIPTVGTVLQFRDTEGNTACAMRYD